MPTNADETLRERYQREHQADLAYCAKMSPDEIFRLILMVEDNNLLAENNRLLRALMGIAMADLVAWDKPEEFPAWAQQKAQEAVRLSLSEELAGVEA